MSNDTKKIPTFCMLFLFYAVFTSASFAANLSVSDVGENTALIRFKDIANDEHGYKIYRNGRWTNTTGSINGGYRNHRLTRLTPNTQYTVRIAPYNDSGTTRGSSISFRTKSSAVSQKPKAPANLSVYYRTQTAARYGFTDVSDNEQGYKIYLNNSLKETLDTISGDGSFISKVLDSLSPDTPYRLRIDVFNANGTTRGPSESFRTEPSVVSQKPKAPANLSVRNIRKTTVFIWFEDLANNEQGYKIYLDGTLTETTSSVNGGYKIVLLANLNPNTQYKVRVDAFNASGTTKGPSRSFKTKSPVVSQKPKAPVNLSVFNPTQTTVRYRFKDESDNEQGYKIYLNNALVKTFSALSGSGGFAIKTLTNLIPNTQYTLRVDVFNASGTTRGPSAPFKTKAATVGWWSPSPNDNITWQWQISGNIDTTLAVDMYDVDLFDTSAETIASLKASGKVVICYFSAGTYEGWREDWNQFFPFITGENYTGNQPPFAGNMADWDERWLDIRRIDLLTPIMQSRMKLADNKGCDGVEPDNMDAYTNGSETGLPLTAQDQLVYNRWIAEQAHLFGLSVGLKNDVEQLPELVDYFDWALNEECFQHDECGAYSTFTQAGKAVFGVEYVGEAGTFCPQAKALNLYWLKKTLALDAWRLGCEDF